VDVDPLTPIATIIGHIKFFGKVASF